MASLATTLGLSLSSTPTLSFHDIYSLSAPDLTHIPRPALALIAIIPLTPAWAQDRAAEDATMPASYPGHGPQEPVIWFKQTIGNACGSIALLHGVLNGPAAAHISPGSYLDAIRSAAIPLDVTERAQMLYESAAFEAAHRAVEEDGDNLSDAAATDGRAGGHFVAFVKSGGRLWELEGSRRGPLVRGELGEEEDVLSARALELGIGRILRVEAEGGGEGASLRFSCVALVEGG